MRGVLAWSVDMCCGVPVAPLSHGKTAPGLLSAIAFFLAAVIMRCLDVMM